MAQVTGICGTEDGSELGAGWGRFSHARIPWTIRYDEVLTVFEGDARAHGERPARFAGTRLYLVACWHRTDL
jgi:ethanolamine utilization protein EutQ (cupin superfamily)